MSGYAAKPPPTPAIPIRNRGVGFVVVASTKAVACHADPTERGADAR